MALSNEEIQFRERIAEFIGTITTKVKQVKDDVDKIEAKEGEVHSRITKVREDCDNKIQVVKDSVTKINTTVEVTKAKLAAYGAIGGVVGTAIIWLAKMLITHYMK